MAGKAIFLKGIFSLAITGLLLQPAWGAEELTVSAAASLTNVFQELGSNYENLHPGVKIIFNMGASGALLQQIDKGAPVDVFASADQKTMDRAQAKGLIVTASRQNFTGNRLVLIRPAAANLALKRVSDLKQPEVKKVAIGNPATVPAGRYAQEGLTRLGLWEPLGPKLIYGESVRQVLDYVARGEVDAGLVFATDAAMVPDKVKIVQEIRETNPIVYPIAVVAKSGKRELALKFVTYLLDPACGEVFKKYGFEALH